MSKVSNARSLAPQPDLTADDLERLRRGGSVAVDNEMTGLNLNRDLLALVQLCDPNGHVTFVRTRDWHAATNLRALMLDAGVLKVFHYALMDCSFIVKHLGVMPVNMYCTKIASKLVRTYTSSHGLGSLVNELCGVQLNKTQQTTDWYSAELTRDQLEYAAGDVAWLLEIRQRLEAKLQARGTLPTGLSYAELNAQCQAALPTMVQLFLNGWSVGADGEPTAVFAH
jgi:ribonuclease D